MTSIVTTPAGRRATNLFAAAAGPGPPGSLLQARASEMLDSGGAGAGPKVIISQEQQTRKKIPRRGAAQPRGSL